MYLLLCSLPYNHDNCGRDCGRLHLHTRSPPLSERQRSVWSIAQTNMDGMRCFVSAPLRCEECYRLERTCVWTAFTLIHNLIVLFDTTSLRQDRKKHFLYREALRSNRRLLRCVPSQRLESSSALPLSIRLIPPLQLRRHSSAAPTTTPLQAAPTTANPSLTRRLGAGAEADDG